MMLPGGLVEAVGAWVGGRAPTAPLGAFTRAVRASERGVTQGWARVPLPRLRLTLALEMSQMFFGKQPEQAEAVGSLLLTQTRCLAPGLILPGDVPGSPQGWQAPAHSSAKGSPAARGSPEPPAGWAPYQTWQQRGSICSGQHWHLAVGGKSVHMCHLHLICTSSAYHAEPPFHHVCDPVTSLQACPVPHPLRSTSQLNTTQAGQGCGCWGN